jgi:tRNA-splicing ligase RtcB
MFHSGSRNLGLKIGDYFNKVASDLNKKWFSVDSHSIPFLPADTEEGKSYLKWMDFALRFAFLNRQVMMDELMRAVSYIIPDTKFYEDSAINIHHNYAAQERHFGRDLFVHRKGAVLAREGIKGVIPGSMGTGSFITEGLGNPDSLCSSSHGAGRTKGRTAFNIEMNSPEKIEQIKKSMDGIVYSGFGKSNRGRDAGMLDVSESPAAYRNINSVMENQNDLVRPIHKLTTMINWKDTGK